MHFGFESVIDSGGHVGDARVARGQVSAEQEGRLRTVAEDLGLEDLDELELSASLELESFELHQLDLARPLFLVHGIALLEQLALLGRSGQDHRLVWPVHLEEDRLLTRFVVLARLGVELLVLRIGESTVDVDVEHRARV